MTAKTVSPTIKIDWEPPAPRSGMRGVWDQFIGPGATTAELVIQFGGALVGGAALLLYYQQLHPEDNLSITHRALVALLGVDMVGGVVTNATAAAKRWYHRSSQTAFDHIQFIAVHAIQIGGVAMLCGDNALVYFGCVYGFVLFASFVILFATPLYLQRPVAMWFVTMSILLAIGLQSEGVGPVGLEWFIPLLCLKLLVSHLVKEAPFAPAFDGKRE